MKKLVLLLLLFSSSLALAQGVKISTTVGVPNASSMLEIESSDRGLLIPRVSLTSRNIALPVTTPANSLLVFNINTAGTIPFNVSPGFYYWDATLLEWIRLTDGSTIISDDQNIDSLTITGTVLTTYIENGLPASTDLLTLASNSNFYSIIRDSLLMDTLFIQNLIDSVDTDDQNIDSITLTSTILTTYIQDGNSANLDLLPLASDSAFYNTIKDSLINDSTFISSIDSALRSDTNFINGLIDSLLTNVYFKDSLYAYTRDSLLLDTAFLNALADSIDTDVDSITLQSDTSITVYENGKAVSVDISPLKDSAEWVDGSLVGLTTGNIYARKALARGDTVMIDTNGRLLLGTQEQTDNNQLIKADADTKWGVLGLRHHYSSSNLSATGTLTLNNYSSTNGRWSTIYFGGTKSLGNADAIIGAQFYGDSNLTLSNRSASLNFITSSQAFPVQYSMKIDTNGHVGIGTTNPAEKLVVNQGSIQMLNNASGPEQLYLYYISPTNYASFGTSSGGGIEFNTGTTTPSTKMYLSPNTGNLGINTITPSHKLDVNGETRIRVINDTNDVAGVLTANAQGVVQNLPYDTLLAKIKDSSEWVDGSLVGLTPGNIYARKALANGDTVVVDVAGRMGIGLNTPTSKLHVDDDRVRFVNTLAGGNHTVVIRAESNPRVLIGDVTSGVSTQLLSNDTTGNVGTANTFDFGMVTNNIERVRLKINGNFGIGTTTPTEKLEVAGDVAIGSTNAANALLRTRDVAGTDQAGSNLVLRGGSSTGNGTSGQVQIFPGSTNDVANSGIALNRKDISKGLYLEYQETNWNDHPNLFRLNAVLGNSASQGNLSGLAGDGVVLTLDGCGNGGEASALEIVGSSNLTSGEQGFIRFYGSTLKNPYATITAATNGNDNTSGGLRFKTYDAGIENIRMSILSNGNVGIGTTTPSEKLEVVGNILASGTIVSSDKRYKRDIYTLDNALDKVLQLRGVSYFMKDEYKDKGFGDGIQIGVIAQEVEKVYPELVNTNEQTGYKAVDYSKFTPILIEALKEEHNQRMDLQLRVDKLEESNTLLKAENSSYNTSVEELKSENKKLNDNYNQLKNELEQIRILLNKGDMSTK